MIHYKFKFVVIDVLLYSCTCCQIHLELIGLKEYVYFPCTIKIYITYPQSIQGTCIFCPPLQINEQELITWKIYHDHFRHMHLQTPERTSNLGLFDQKPQILSTKLPQPFQVWGTEQFLAFNGLKIMYQNTEILVFKQKKILEFQCISRVQSPLLKK